MRKSHKLLAVLSLLGIVLLGGGNLFAQNRTCQGTVKDAQGEPVIMASVLIKGAPVSTGVVTDVEGKFVQPNAKVGDVLVISCIGYATTEVAWNGSPLNVVMADDQNLLEETVVTAYGGRQLRTKVTNSISSVKEDVLASGMHTNPAQALSGAVAGLSVRQTSGDPGATPTMVLRGGTDLDGSGSPLIIIDGAQRSSLGDINPNDIESIEVLKDAGATAIYGARAANGVVLVTTKRGKEGYSAINVRAKFSANYFNTPYEFLPSDEYLWYMRMSYKRGAEVAKLSDGSWRGFASMGSLTGVQPYGTGNLYYDSDGKTPLNGRVSNRALWGVLDNSTGAYSSLLSDPRWGEMVDPVYGGKMVFWQGETVSDLNFKSPAFSQDYGVDFQGGNDKGSYYASIGYNRSEGNALDNDYNRISFVFNGDYKIRRWLHSSSSFNFSHNTWTPIKNGNSHRNYFARALSLPPTFRVYNTDGEYNPSPRGNIQDSAVALSNPYRTYDYNTDKFNMNQTFTVIFAPWLNFKASASWYYEDTKQEYFMRDYLRGPNNWYRSRESYDYYNRNLNQTYNGILNFNNTFAEYHNVTAMLGVEYLDQGSKGFDAYGYNAPTDDFQDLSYADKDTRDIDSWHNQNRILSFFGKLDYDYDAKYLLSLVARYDGYSRLLDNRWGFFPGISAGWVFSKEDFMAGARDVISFAKLRMSYGANGNIPMSGDNAIGNYTLQGAYGSQTEYNGNKTILLSTLPNPALRWEKSWTYEVGLDMSFFQNRLNTNITYYNRHTADKIAKVTVPTHTGVSGILSNNGEVQNQGVEFEISARIVNTSDWKVNLGLNGAYNRNKIIKLPFNGLENNRQDAFQAYVADSYDPSKKGEGYLNNSDYMWVGGYQEGQTPGDIYGFVAEGIYRSYDEIPGNLVDESTAGWASSSIHLYGPKAWDALSDAEKKAGLPIQPGDTKWKDVNGDGKIDNYDRVKLGNTVPKWTGGFNANASWKGLTLSGRFDYALGHKVFDAVTPWFMGNMQGTFNTLVQTRESFNPETGEGKYPMYYWADQLGKRNYYHDNTSMFVYDASYLAIREITLGYDLPKNLTNAIHMQRVNVFVSGQNLGYITKAKLLCSPEYGADNWGAYSLPRTVIFGVNLTF